MILPDEALPALCTSILHTKQMMWDEWNSDIGGTSNSHNPPSQNIWSSILLNNVRWPSWSYYVLLQPIYPQLSGMWLYLLQKASNRNMWLKIEQVIDKKHLQNDHWMISADRIIPRFKVCLYISSWFLKTGKVCREIKA